MHEGETLVSDMYEIQTAHIPRGFGRCNWEQFRSLLSRYDEKQPFPDSSHFPEFWHLFGYFNQLGPIP